MDTATIKLGNGVAAIIDAADLDLVGGGRWFALPRPHTTYVYGYLPGGSTQGRVYLHRVLTKAAPGQEVDHINHDGLDNRRTNLRLCTRSENGRNSRPRGTNETGFIGVYYYARLTKPFVARLKHHGKFLHIGCFATAEEAARARDSKAQELHGEFATLNYPTGSTIANGSH